MNLSVHLLRQPDPAALATLRDNLDAGVRITHGPDLPVPADYHIFIDGRPQREHLTASPNLRAIIIPFAGLPDTTRELVLSDFPHLAVHNLHYNAVPVAETVLALMLAAAKFIVPMDRALRAHDWTARYHSNPSVLLEGKTALILGYGAIGQRVAHFCRALGMKVMAIRRHLAAPSPGTPDEIYPPDALHSLLPRTNVLLVCLPHTPDTAGLIGEGELALLPSGALLVNVGRGPVVDEAALYHALCERTLRAAGLDVWYNYPADEAAQAHTPPSTYPFHELDNVVMSPHRGGHFDDRGMLRMRHLAVMLNAAARGQDMPNRVDVAAGY